MGSERKLRLTKRSLMENINHDGEDRISELPDSLLEHILAFLPTKTAVWTSILSKRWSKVWTAVPLLHFELLEPSPAKGILSKRDCRLETMRIMKFVDRTLRLHKPPKLRKFYLSIDSYFDKSRVNEWITTVIRRNVEKLILVLYLTKSFRFPCCLFTCESLIKLDIIMGLDVLDLPNVISFPKLKILKLTQIRIKDENWTQQFFSNCPVLEELLLHSCNFRGLKFLSISTPKLKSLSIYKASGSGTPVVKIYAPSLLSFTFTESGPMDYVLHSFPLLVHADIYFTCGAKSKAKRGKRGYVAAKLLEKLSNVNRLRINSSILLAMSFEDGFLTNFPTFHNLIHLEVCTDIGDFIDRTFLDFLQISPNIESVVFFGSYLVKIKGADWTLNLEPSCPSLNLKSFEFHEFSGNPMEVAMVKYLLKHAGVLQRMTITTKPCLSLKKRDNILKELIEFPKASTSCLVTMQSSRKTLEL